MPRLQGIDLNLMTVFIEIFDNGSTAKAAERLGLSQSATSHALSRLRAACGDDLFIRVGQGLRPTPVARRILPEVRRALDALRTSIGEARAFDPPTASRRFALAIPHPLGPIWALRLRAAIAAEAPGVALTFDTRTMALNPDERLADGTIDLAVDWVPIELDRFVNQRLFADGVGLVARRGHPRVRTRPSLAALRRESFVACHLRRQHGPSRSLPREIAAHGISATLQVSEFLEVPFVVAESDLLGLMPDSMAHHAEQRFGLQVLPLPFPLDPVPIWLTWHETRRRDAGHAWLRAKVRSVLGEQAPPMQETVSANAAEPRSRRARRGV